jgi:hypothetical protein
MDIVPVRDGCLIERTRDGIRLDIRIRSFLSFAVHDESPAQTRKHRVTVNEGSGTHNTANEPPNVDSLPHRTIEVLLQEQRTQWDCISIQFSH